MRNRVTYRESTVASRTVLRMFFWYVRQHAKPFLFYARFFCENQRIFIRKITQNHLTVGRLFLGGVTAGLRKIKPRKKPRFFWKSYHFLGFCEVFCLKKPRFFLFFCEVFMRGFNELTAWFIKSSQKNLAFRGPTPL